MCCDSDMYEFNQITTEFSASVRDIHWIFSVSGQSVKLNRMRLDNVELTSD